MDSLINPRYLETYADPESRAGVLEPEGIVEVKYKEKDLLTTIQRVDPITINVRHIFKSGILPNFPFQLAQETNERG